MTRDALDETIGANLRFLRRKRGWTQARLAFVLGISHQQLQKIERGVNRLPASRLFRIADLFQLEPNVFRTPRLFRKGDRDTF